MHGLTTRGMAYNSILRYCLFGRKKVIWKEKGQVWTRHLAPAAATCTQAFIAFSVHCLSGWPFNVHGQIVLPCTLPSWGGRQGLLVLGIIAWSRLGIALSWVVAFACVPCWLAPSGVCLL